MIITDDTLVIANTYVQQHKRQLYTWTSPEGQYGNQAGFIICCWRLRSSIQSAKTRLGADCGWDYELLTENSDLNWRKKRHPLDHPSDKWSESGSVMSNPMDNKVHVILQSRIVQWVAFPSSRESSQPRSLVLQVDSSPAEPQGQPLDHSDKT